MQLVPKHMVALLAEVISSDFSCVKSVYVRKKENGYVLWSKYSHNKNDNSDIQY